PLTAHVQHLQDAVEGLVQGQCRPWSAPTRAQMRQDKFFELRLAQFHGNEPPRDFRRLHFLRKWSYGKHEEEVPKVLA
ncbi:hypothetical protein, partial [Paraburkholderia sp. BR14320]|uniref:hypothetical protein n=1 Tax=unclassified Paraburkholderia TaxID=2615204 RepID=UPI0034CEE00C